MIRFSLHPQGKSGFTLLETIVALAIILAAVVGPVSLITRGIFAFSFSKNKVIAVNLAQEGVEMVRLIRENNIACDYLNGPLEDWAWNRAPSPPTGPGTAMHGTTFRVDIESFTDIHCPDGTQKISTPRISTSCADPLRFDPITGTYGYSSSGNPTIFYRCLEIKSPPDDPDIVDTPIIPADDQMDVIATVTWNERGNARSIVLRERLYHWE